MAHNGWWFPVVGQRIPVVVLGYNRYGMLVLREAQRRLAGVWAVPGPQVYDGHGSQFPSFWLADQAYW
jgi:hypothetical protein